MSLIEWNAAFSVGVPELDGQHRRWVEIINGLYDDMNDREIERGVVEVATLSAMMNYARNHFITEERHMQEIGFPGTVAHIKTHNQCYGLIYSHLLSAEYGDKIHTLALLNFLKEWLNEHILCEDKKYCTYLAEQQGQTRQF